MEKKKPGIAPYSTVAPTIKAIKTPTFLASGVNEPNLPRRLKRTIFFCMKFNIETNI